MQLVIQLRSVVAEYVLSGMNIDGRHCDTVMPSTTTARRARTRIEEQTYRARISPPGLKRRLAPPSIYSDAKSPRLSELSH
jgi:hypothetical protein